MIDIICAHIRNWFTAPADIVKGTFTIAGGNIDLTDIVLPGQYYRIVGSTLNDGAYLYTPAAEGVAGELIDETFTGEIWPMKVPRPFRQLVTEIEAWQDKYGAAMASPYQSETVTGVYAYTKQGGTTSQGAAGDADGWKTIFKSRLNAWRKLQ